MSLSPDEFGFFRTWLQTRTAILLEPGKEYLVETRLLPVAQKHALDGAAGVVRQLRGPTPRALEDAVVEALTTNETSFFRDLRPFEALKKVLLPELVAKRAQERRLDIWSAACSSGQEVYSLAMVLSEHFPQLGTWDVQLHCTDLSTEMVERTRAGRFSQLEVNRGLPAPMLVKYFQQDKGDWVVVPHLRKLVRATTLNLAQAWPAMPTMDLVLLRNVLIYFDVPTKKAILERMRRQLRPGGALFLGSAETTLGLHDGYKRDEGAGSVFFRVA